MDSRAMFGMDTRSTSGFYHGPLLQSLYKTGLPEASTKAHARRTAWNSGVLLVMIEILYDLVYPNCRDYGTVCVGVSKREGP